MKSQRDLTVLSFAHLQRAYVLTLENSGRFFDAASALAHSFPDKALALAQLGQEELGRSLTVLAAFALPVQPESWRWFWSGWNKHDLKAHRAYLYELINPLRIELTKEDGSRFAGEPLRRKLSSEKEVGFYVDYDEDTDSICSPPEQVTAFDVMARMSTVLYLSLTADAVKRSLLCRDEEVRLRSFGDLVLRICSEDLYQQDMPRLIEEFSRRSPKHQELVRDLDIALKEVASLLADQQNPTRVESPKAES